MSNNAVKYLKVKTEAIRTNIVQERKNREAGEKKGERLKASY